MNRHFKSFCFGYLSNKRNNVIKRDKFIHIWKTIVCLIIAMLSVFAFSLLFSSEINAISISSAFDLVFFLYPLMLDLFLFLYEFLRFIPILTYSRPIIKKHDLYNKVYLPVVYEIKNIKTVFILALLVGLVSIYPCYKIYVGYKNIVFILMPIITYFFSLLMPVLILLLNKKRKSCNYLFDKANKNSKSHE